jgi:hypothetical protein
MEKKSLKEFLLPHLLIVGGFLLICCIYFSPLLKGKVLQQHDLIQFEGSSKEALDYNKATGQSAYWTNSMFGGMPTYQIALGFPNSSIAIRWIYTFFVKAIPHPINSVLFYMIGFYLLLLSYRLDKWVCAIGAIAFAFSSYNFVIIDAGHVNQSYALAFAPFVLAALNFTFRSRRYLLGSALFGIAFVTEIKANHIQITYYLLLLMAFYLAYELYIHIRLKALPSFVKATIGISVAMILAIGSNFTNLYLTNEYSKQTIRGKAELTQKSGAKSEGIDKDYALQWSLGIPETGTIIIPDIRGGSQAAIGEKHPKSVEKNVSDPQIQPFISNFDEYWGHEPAVAVIYFGSIICFLFVLGLLILERTEKWWLLGATLLSIMLAWGNYFLPLTNIFFDYFPFYNKFRSVSMIIVIASITVPILSFFILDRILSAPELLRNNMKKFYIAFGVTGGLCLLLYIAPSFAGDFQKPENGDMQSLQQMVQGSFPADQAKQFFASGQSNTILSSLQEVRADILKADAIRSFFFIALAAAFLWLFSTGRIKKNIVLGGFGLLVLFDMAIVDSRYLGNEDFKTKQLSKQTLSPSPADEAIMQDPDPDYRVLNLTVSPFNDATTSYFHKSIGGYHGAKLRRIQELIENMLFDDINVKLRGNHLDSAVAINMLNTKYIITKADANGVIKNPFALGNAWFIKEVKMADNADQEMAMLRHIDPKNQAIVNKKFSDYFRGGNMQFQQGGNIKLDKYSPNEISYSYSAPSDGFVAFSEVYYNPDADWHKGDWHASIDGKEAGHIRINYVLRGMKVPAGAHKIDFKFVPHSYFMGENVSLASSILLLLLIGGAIYYEWKKKDVDDNVPA